MNLTGNQLFQAIFEVLNTVEDLFGQQLLMICSYFETEFLVEPSQDVMYLSLELFAGSFEDEVLIAVPSCQFLILFHLFLLALPNLLAISRDIGQEVVVEADDSLHDG